MTYREKLEVLCYAGGCYKIRLKKKVHDSILMSNKRKNYTTHENLIRGRKIQSEEIVFS